MTLEEEGNITETFYIIEMILSILSITTCPLGKCSSVDIHFIWNPKSGIRNQSTTSQLKFMSVSSRLNILKM